MANLSSGLGTVAMSSVGGVLAADLGYRATSLTSATLVAVGVLTVRLGFGYRYRSG